MNKLNDGLVILQRQMEKLEDAVHSLQRKISKETLHTWLPIWFKPHILVQPSRTWLTA